MNYTAFVMRLSTKKVGPFGSCDKVCGQDTEHFFATCHFENSKYFFSKRLCCSILFSLFIYLFYLFFFFC